MRTKLLAVLVAALALSTFLLAGGASAQRAARQGNDNASGGGTKRVVGVRSSDTGNGSRVSITADDSLKDYSAYRSGDRFYVVLPKAAAGGARGGGGGKGYSDMQVQQRGDSVVLSYRVQPGAKPRVEQKFNRLDVVFDVPGDAAQQAAAANNNARPPQPQQTPPAENRNTAATQNNQRQAAAGTPGANPTPERRQPTAEETARTQAASATSPVVTPVQPTANVGAGAQQPAPPSVEPTQEPAAASPTAEPQLAQAQQPAPIAPITTSQPAAATQTGASLGTYLIQNWWLAFVFALVVAGLGLIISQRRSAAATPAPVEELENKSAAKKIEEPRTSRAKEATARALKDASSAAQAATLDTAQTSKVGTAEVVSKVETAGTAEASVADVKPLVGAAALAGGAAAAKSKKQSRKEARQEAKRKKGAHVEAPASAEAPVAENMVAAPVAQETAVEETAAAAPVAEETAAVAPVTEETVAIEPSSEETLVHEEPSVETLPVEQTAVAKETAAVAEALVEAPPVEEPLQEESAEVAQAVTTIEVAEPVRFEASEAGLETAAPVLETSEVETREVAPFDAEAAEPFVALAEAPAPVTEIEPAFAPEPERVLNETHSLLEGEEYDRAVVGSRDAMARQMVAAELLAALASRNAQRRERAGAAFVEHGYFDETARDLREADAPAERSAAARSLALLGDRSATPLLVAALEDPVTDVRRAAVEALGALRDPSAVEPLEALLERERNERNRIPPRVIRTAVEFCREGFAQAPAAETQTAAPVEAAQHDEVATVEIAPVEEASVETAQEPFVDFNAPEAAEETSASITPFVDETFGAEPLVAPEPAAEATGEPAHVSEPVHAAEALETITETGVEPFVETEAAVEVDAAEVREEYAQGAAVEVAIEPVAERAEEVSTAGTLDFVTEPHEPSGQATLFDAAADEATREIEPVVADSSNESRPPAGEVAAGQWFDFDMGEMGDETQPAAERTTTPEPSSAESIFETSSGETLAAPASSEVVEAAEETAPFAETYTEPTRDIEAAGAVAAAPPVMDEPAPYAHEPAAEAHEKGLAPFDELSTVPASIQQRIASEDARERAAAIVELSHVDTDEAFQQVCAAFDDRSQEVRSAAARALYELRGDRAESFTRALREATPERRREIGAAIATSGLAGESISQLTGESRERTYEAFSLLFLMAKAGEVQPLLRAIEGHPSNEVRLAVVKLLALSGQKEVLPAFRRLAVRGSLPTEVRSAVMEAIYQISSSQPTHA
ncbi:MAG: HEAT repeat domain-containing protein [Pyrinomonadaceae bacterium]